MDRLLAAVVCTVVEAVDRVLLPGRKWSLAVLGPFRADAPSPWNPEQVPDFAATYETTIGEPYQDVAGRGRCGGGLVLFVLRCLAGRYGTGTAR